MNRVDLLAQPRFLVAALNLSLLVVFGAHWLVLAVMLATTGALAAQRGPLRILSPVATPLAAYYAAAGASLVLIRDVGMTTHWAFDVAIVAAVFLPAAAQVEVERALVCRFVVLMACVLSVYAVLEVGLGLPRPGGPMRDADGAVIPMPNEIFLGSGLGRAEVTLGHPLLLAFVLVVALALALHPTHALRGRLWIAASLLCGILATGSRSAAGIAVLLVVVTLGRRLVSAMPAPRRWVGVVGGVIALVVSGAVALLAGVGQAAVVTNFLSDPSLGHRLGGIEAAIRLFGEQPWWQTLAGNGYWSTPRLFVEGKLQSDNFFAVDNQFAYTFVELGLVGLLVLGWLLVRALFRTDGFVAGGVAAGVAMFLSYDVLVTPSSLGLLALLLGATRTRVTPRDIIARAYGSSPTIIPGYDEALLRRAGRQQSAAGSERRPPRMRDFRPDSSSRGSTCSDMVCVRATRSSVIRA